MRRVGRIAGGTCVRRVRAPRPRARRAVALLSQSLATAAPPMLADARSAARELSALLGPGVVVCAQSPELPRAIRQRIAAIAARCACRAPSGSKRRRAALAAPLRLTSGGLAARRRAPRRLRGRGPPSRSPAGRLRRPKSRNASSSLRAPSCGRRSTLVSRSASPSSEPVHENSSSPSPAWRCAGPPSPTRRLESASPPRRRHCRRALGNPLTLFRRRSSRNFSGIALSGPGGVAQAGKATLAPGDAKTLVVGSAPRSRPASTSSTGAPCRSTPIAPRANSASP